MIEKLRAWVREARMRARSWGDARGKFYPPRMVAAVAVGVLPAILLLLVVPQPEAQSGVGLGVPVTGITSDGPSAVVSIGGHDGRQVAIQVWGTWDGAGFKPSMRLCSSCAWETIPGFGTTPSTETTGERIVGPVWAYTQTEFRIEVSSAGGSTNLSYVVVK